MENDYNSNSQLKKTASLFFGARKGTALGFTKSLPPVKKSLCEYSID